jgi:hypothetical protein
MEISVEGHPNGRIASSHADPGDANGPNRARRGLILIGSAWTLVLLGSIGVLYTGNLVWIHNLEHPFVFGCLAAGLSAAGIGQLQDESWLHALTGLLNVGAMLGLMTAWGIIGLLWTIMVGTHQVASAEAPGDSGYKAVVTEQNNVIDTLWTVYVSQTRGPLSREWLAGCISSDPTGASSIEYVEWQGPRYLVVYTDHSSIGISVDPRTGKPQSSTPTSAQEAC